MSLASDTLAFVKVAIQKIDALAVQVGLLVARQPPPIAPDYTQAIAAVDKKVGDLTTASANFGASVLGKLEEIKAMIPVLADPGTGGGPVVVIPGNLPPEWSLPDIIQTTEGVSFSVDFLASGYLSDPEDDTLTVSLASGTLPAGWTLFPAGSLSYIITNVALSSVGAVASASSEYTAQVPQLLAARVNDNNLGTEWASATPTFPQWVQILFTGQKTIGRIDVSTFNPATFGLQAFQVQYFQSGIWSTIPGGNVTGNTQTTRSFTFSPITTDRIRVLTSAAGDGYSRVTTLSAWTVGQGGTADVTFSVTDGVNTVVSPTVTINTAIDCLLSDWSAPVYGDWSACVNFQRSRSVTRTRTVVTAPQYGGASCGATTEVTTETGVCGLETPPTISFSQSYATPTLTDTNVPAVGPKKLELGKHVNMAYCPLDGKIYVCGGDGQGHHWSGSPSSGNVDTVGRYDVDTHTYVTDYLYQGYTGECVPRGLDFIAFTWIPTLNEFWLGPGFSWNYTTSVYPWLNTAWTTFKFASYNPVTKHFTDRGDRPPGTSLAYDEGWQAAWDSRRNRLIWFTPAGESIKIMDPNNPVNIQQQWPTLTGFGSLSPHPIQKSKSWYDADSDELYVWQQGTGNVYAIHIGNNTCRILVNTGVLLNATDPDSDLKPDTTRAVIFLTDLKYMLIVYSVGDSRATNPAAPLLTEPWKLINLANGSMTGFNGFRPGFTRADTGAYHVPSRTIVLSGGGTDGNLENGRWFHEYSVAPLPSWVPAVGDVAAIAGPGTAAPGTMWQVMYQSSSGPGSFGTGSALFQNWASGCYAKDDGLYGSMVFCNGGDADYWGNEVYKFNLETRTWSRPGDRSEGLNGNTAAGGDPNFSDGTWGEHTSPDGTPPPQPGVPHDYDEIEYLPPSLGGGAKGALLFPSRGVVYRTRFFAHPHFFDLAEAPNGWHRGTSSPGAIAYDGSISLSTWCFDSSRNRFWGLRVGQGELFTSRINYLTFNLSTRLATPGTATIPQVLTPAYYPTTRYWPKGDILLMCGVNSLASPTTFIIKGIVLTTAGLAAGFSQLNLTGSTIPATSGGVGLGGYGLAYCPDLECFFIRTSAGSRQTIWKLTPPASSYLTSAWTVTAITMAGATVASHGASQGLYKRFMYVPILKSLLWTDDVQQNVYAYRVI